MSEISDADRQTIREIWQRSSFPPLEEFAAALAQARREGRRAPDPVMAKLIEAANEVLLDHEERMSLPQLKDAEAVPHRLKVMNKLYAALEAARKGTT